MIRSSDGETGSVKGPLMSVVVPTYNRRDSVLRLLAALRDQTTDPTSFEVVVSIDGSADGTLESVESFEAPYAITPVYGPNRGRATACNAGIAKSRGRLLVILDDDMEPEPGFLAAHLHAHSRGGRLGVLGAVPIRTTAESPPVVRFVAEKFNAHLARLAEGAEIRFRSFFSGNFSIEREVLGDAGLYDESFRIYGNEDTELSLRLLRAGVRLVYEPDAIAYQNYEKDFGGLARDNYAKGRTAVLAARKHPEEFGPFTAKRFRETSGKWRMSRRWMVARAVLVRASRVAPALPDLVIRAVHAAEAARFSRLDTLYRFVIDYFFWSGVEAALAEPGATPLTGSSSGDPEGIAGEAASASADRVATVDASAHPTAESAS